MKDQLLPTVVRCRERRKDVAPLEGVVHQHPQRYLRVGAVSNGPTVGGNDGQLRGCANRPSPTAPGRPTGTRAPPGSSDGPARDGPLRAARSRRRGVSAGVPDAVGEAVAMM